MSRALHRLQWQRRVDRHSQIQFAQRLGSQQIASQPVAVSVAVASQRKDLRVDDLHPLLGVRLDREDACLEQVPRSPFEQPRIASLAQDGLVNFTGTLLLDDVRIDEIVADPHAEPADRRILRQREMEGPFQPRPRVIDERFLDGRPRDLIANLDRDLVIAHRQRFVATIGQLHDQRTKRLVVGSPFKPGQPHWHLRHVHELLVPVNSHELLGPRRELAAPFARGQQNVAVTLRVTIAERGVRVCFITGDFLRVRVVRRSAFLTRSVRATDLHLAHVQPSLHRRNALD